MKIENNKVTLFCSKTTKIYFSKVPVVFMVKTFSVLKNKPVAAFLTNFFY